MADTTRAVVLDAPGPVENLQILDLAEDQIQELSLPFERASIELAYEQILRRWGHRRAAMMHLEAARERFAALGARPFVERCVRELGSSGLAPTKRTDADPLRLTPQELAVARLAATGMSNRDIASEMTVSIKTVQFHVSKRLREAGIALAGAARQPTCRLGWGLSAAGTSTVS